jgi:hypothetical protein
MAEVVGFEIKQDEVRHGKQRADTHVDGCGQQVSALCIQATLATLRCMLGARICSTLCCCTGCGTQLRTRIG